MTKEQLGVLILDCERQLYSTAKTILYSDQDCADAIQDTIVKAFSKIQTLKNDKYAKTWLIRILINECYTILRKSSKLTSLDCMLNPPFLFFTLSFPLIWIISSNVHSDISKVTSQISF